jgi:hypothetical protein
VGFHGRASRNLCLGGPLDQKLRTQITRSNTTDWWGSVIRIKRGQKTIIMVLFSSLWSTLFVVSLPYLPVDITFSFENNLHIIPLLAGFLMLGVMTLTRLLDRLFYSPIQDDIQVKLQQERLFSA